MGRKSKSKVPQQKLDLSEEIISNESRKVADYDYDLLQSGNPDEQFENDLDYLLESVDNQPMSRSDAKELFIPDEIAIYEEAISNDGPVQKGRKAKKFKITLTDITKDINDINFSSDSEHEKPIEASKTKKEKTKTKIKTDLDIGKLDGRIVADNPHEIENHSSESEEIKQRRKEKRQRKDQRRKLRKANQQESKNDSTTEQPEPLKNINEKITSNEPSDQEMKKKPKKDKKKKKEKSNTNDTKKFKGDIKHEELENNKGPDSVELTEEEIAEALSKEENEIDTALNETLKKSKRKDRKKKKQARDENPNKEQSPPSTILVSKTDELVTLDELKSQKVVDQEYSIYDGEANLTRKERDKLHRERLPEASYKELKDKHNPFDVTLRSTKKTNTNKKYSDSLPAVQCIKTIIGLSHQQILSLSLSDVKIKTIVSSSSISKFAHHVLKFVIKYSHDLFTDDQKKQTFFKLCMNVALYESSGFRKTVQSCPHALEWFGHYEELTLEQTHTRLTPSSRNIHQNNFDYSVLAYIGHVLIWAAYQQRLNNMPTFFNKYNIELSVNEIEKSIGGFHLWDRLRKMHDTMNSKRWKHVVKFRQAFAYEEDQFMLILRFMDVDSTIP